MGIFIHTRQEHIGLTSTLYINITFLVAVIGFILIIIGTLAYGTFLVIDKSIIIDYIDRQFYMHLLTCLQNPRNWKN